MFADVLVEVKAKQIDHTFTYLIPEDLKGKIKVGMRVLVPFSTRQLEGFVMSISNEKDIDFELKEITSLVDEEPVLNEELLELGKYISKRTLCTLITTYQAMLPNALKAKHGFTVNKKYQTYVKLVNHVNSIKVNEKQQIIIDMIGDGKILKSEAKAVSLSALNTLIKNGLVEEIKEEVYRLNDDLYEVSKPLELTSNQQNVVNEISKDLNKFSPILLHGVTGSGKTEVYMNIIKQVLDLKKEAIVLVPEISLTPQLVSTFKRRFTSSVAIIHSGLSSGEKYDEWRKIVRGEVSIVIGARSAIFAPFTNLGIIIIDEEHSSTYKQDNNPKYSTIDVAIYRAKKYNIPLVLGSATPSIESYTRATTGNYKLLTLDKRINNDLPQVTLIDMKDEIKHNHKVLSRVLIDKINNRLEKKEQVILLLNRRGYSTVITCHSCGYTDKCPNCDIPLTLHQTSKSMKCHYCGYNSHIKTICPECKSKDINQFGMGTEKLEEYLKNTFKNARIARMDVDTTSNKGAHANIINDFMDLKYDILVGTQMISKGLDFPNVTLVGVLNGDASLNIPDFRSAERTYQLLNQVAGRAGRGLVKGEVIIQAFNIDHYSIVKASKHDYLSFYNEELNIRKTLKYPPYYNLCLIKISSKDYDLALKEANKISSYLRNEMPDNIILGPSSAAMPKINNIHYLQIIIKYKKTDTVVEKLNFINNQYKANNKVSVDIDLSPYKI